MLTITDLTLRVAGRVLLEEATLVLPAGAKAGLVGRNGSGKTTLFRGITGAVLPDSGSISLPKNLTIGIVEQEAPGSGDTPLEIVLQADRERVALLDEAKTAADPARIAEIQIRLADIGSHAAEARAGAILHGLGFEADAQNRPVSSFSGGWRMRVALAALLFAEPDLLLLDEPTNYLDLEGTMWLETYLARYPRTVLLISHDRDLLNQAVSSIVHLEQGKLKLYNGGYDQFERQRRETMVLKEKQQAKQEVQRKHMEAFVERFRYKASKARQAQSRLKALEKLGPLTAILSEGTRAFSFPQPVKAVASPAIALENVAVGYEPGTPVLSRLNLRIDADDRIALLGSNGNGKSTFAKLVAGRMKPERGTMTVAPGLKTAIFAQHQLDDLVADDSAYQHVRRALPDEPEAKIRSRVARMGLSTEKMDTEAAKLSGGEKARLLLGLATLAGPNLLILDEPTNHLDIDSRAALVEALNDFTGAVILISHDRHLIEATMDRLWLVHDGTVATYDGNLEEYRRFITGAQARYGKSRVADYASEKSVSGSKAERRRVAAKQRELLKPLARKIKETEALMKKLSEKIQAIEIELSHPELYTEDPGRAAALAKESARLSAAAADHEETWLQLSDEYETGMASHDPT